MGIACTVRIAYAIELMTQGTNFLRITTTNLNGLIVRHAFIIKRGTTNPTSVKPNFPCRRCPLFNSA